MKQLIIVRHGLDGDKGRVQISSLAEKLKLLVDSASVIILSSAADRALGSAEIIGIAFGVGFEKHEILWSGGLHFDSLPGALELVRSCEDRADVLISVTHYEYAESFPEYFADKEWGIKLHSYSIKKGQAWVLDCAKKTLTRIT